MIDEIIQRVVVSELTQFLQDYTETLKRNLQSEGKLATGDLYQSIQFTVSGFTGTISMEEYGEFVDKGRRAGGKFPPPPAIKEWIITKGLTMDDSDKSLETQQDTLTYLISRKIAEEGIPPTNFIEDPQVTQMEQRIQNRVETEIKLYIEGL